MSETDTTTTTETTTTETDKSKSETVSRADHERALADLHKHKKEAADLKKEKADAANAKLKETNSWKELAEAKEKEADEAKKNAERIQTSYLGEKKFSAVQAKCLALGLRAEAVSDLEMLDLDAITIETTSTGKINVLGADRFAEKLKTLKPHWFAEPKKPVVNSDGSRVLDSSGAVTVADIMAAEKEGRKSGDMSKYYDLHKKFQTQRQASR